MVEGLVLGLSCRLQLMALSALISLSLPVLLLPHPAVRGGTGDRAETHAAPEAQQGGAEQAQPGHPAADCGGGQC